MNFHRTLEVLTGISSVSQELVYPPDPPVILVPPRDAGINVLREILKNDPDNDLRPNLR